MWIRDVDVPGELIDPACTDRLVVIDTDLGHAYVREAWTAWFLDRMFLAFTILFIGLQLRRPSHEAP